MPSEGDVVVRGVYSSVLLLLPEALLIHRKMMVLDGIGSRHGRYGCLEAQKQQLVDEASINSSTIASLDSQGYA